MYKVLFRNTAYLNLDNFINSFSGVFIKMYTDTGIYDEKIIIDSYIKLGEELRELIMNNIYNYFSGDKLLGTFSREKEKFIVITINNFKVFVYFSEDKNLRTRIIEKLEFFKK